MCFDEGRLQAFIDGELNASEAGELQDHLNACEECEAVYKRLLDNDLLVRTSMEGLIVSDRERFNAELAWSKLKLRQSERQNKQKGKWFNAMRYKRIIPAAVALAVAAVIGLTPVSGMAGNFLTIFRVEKVKAITISPADMRQMEKVIKEGTGGADIKNFGKIEVKGTPEARPVTLEEAGNAVDFNLKVPSIQGYSGPQLKEMEGTSVTLSLDVDKVNSVLATLGGRAMLPRELDGQEFTLNVPVAIIASYTGPEGCLTLAQSRGPSVKTASGVDIMTIRQALLGIPALPENLRDQLLAVDDWQHTILVPVRKGQSTDVRVNGSDGVFINQSNDGKAMGALVWQSGGVITALAGDNLTMDRALAIAGTIK